MNRLIRPLVRLWNYLRGYGFTGHEAWPGTCPYPLRHDWSAKACVKAGDCGCVEMWRESLEITERVVNVEQDDEI